VPLESQFQARLIKELKRLFPGCIVLKNDPNYLQGMPDLTILYKTYWAVLEVKRSADEPRRPNQEYYVDLLNDMSFAAIIYPENKLDVLDALSHAFGVGR